MDDRSKSAEPKDPRVEAALRDYLERVDRGESVDREEFLARNALIADQLRSFIAAEEDVRKLAGADAPLDRTYDSTKSLAGHGQETIAPQSVGKRAVEAETGGTGLAGQFGRYRIIRALGKGAMGTVYLAEDTQLERSVAIKTPHFTADPTGEQTERFFREARAAGNLRHPGICPIHDVGQIDGKHYISMAYIEGRSLSAFIQPDKPQTERQILIVIRKLALALQEAHDQGVVHRDLKPANIMVDKKGEPIIMDFGLAHQVRRNEDVRLTQTGNILGTPAFMSPEQVEGEPEKIGSSTDQYSLGVILYELLTSQLPFRGSVLGVMGQILTKEPPPPSQLRPDLDLRIEAVCLKMMAKTPSERFGTLKAVADELAVILKSPAAKLKPADTGGPVGTGAPTARATQSPGAKSSQDRTRAGVGSSQVLKSLKQQALTENDLESLGELARKCYSRRDFEQVIQIIERVPEKRRNTALQALLEKSHSKVDEISFLICDIDEAVRLNDRQRALKKAEELLAIKPGHHRALKVQEDFAGYGAGGAARIGRLQQFTQPWNEGGWIPWSVLAFGLAVFGVTTAVIVVWLGKTAIVIDVKDPGIEVAVKGTKITLSTPNKETFTIEPGERRLAIRYKGVEFATEKSFEIKKGETKLVTVLIVDSKLVARLENQNTPLTPDQEEKTPRPAASGKEPAPAAGGNSGFRVARDVGAGKADGAAAVGRASANSTSANGFVPLFNGKDLTGWSVESGDANAWTVEQGTIVARGEKYDTRNYLLTDREYGDFVLRVEFNFEPGAASGILLRAVPHEKVPFRGRPIFDHPVFKLLDRPRPDEQTGTTHFLYDGVDIQPDRGAQMLPAGSWNQLEIEVKGRSMRAWVNRNLIIDRSVDAEALLSDGTIPGLNRKKGRIGLQKHTSTVRFRNIEIRELPANRVNANLPLDGFVPLFNGKDLIAWKANPDQPDNWRVENGILTGSGRKVSDLYTERTDFKDFHLRVEARINDGGNSGVFFRVQPDFAGRYEAQINGTHEDPNKTGSLYPHANKVIVPYRDTLVSPGEWFNMEVIAVKNHIVITVNGTTTVDYWDPDRHFDGGAIGLQLHDPRTVVEFRKIEIQELTPPSSSTSVPNKDADRRSVEAVPSADPSIAETNRTKEQRFLTANKTKEGIKTRPSGLQYLILEGGKGKRPGLNDSVTVHYKGTLLNGQIFDDGAARPAPPKSLSLKQVIPGWREALQLMKEGSTWRVYIPSELAYGSRGAPNAAIGPNETLIFEIELLKVEHARRR